MTRDEIAAVLARYADAKNRHDVGAILDVCTEDCFYESVALGARVEGREALRAFYTDLFAQLPDYFGRFDGVAYGADTAVVWGRFGGTANGRRVEVPVSFVCTLRDGRIAGDVGYFDAATLAEQAGVPLTALRPSAAGAFVQRFAEVWAAPRPELFPPLLQPDAVTVWPGAGEVRADQYPEHVERILSLFPDLRLEVVDHAATADGVMIAWRAHATVGGEPRAWSGVDRFVLRDGRVAGGEITFDTAIVTEVLAAAA
ncbi:MAG TPA: nuclear transport factor 2 family protein [Solirubrobacteraceae bacterium]|nr:nuclear transport factor 2 family protein [Solirubrobacteraceae bacterium]